jgi:FkbM family methyltransferase
MLLEKFDSLLEFLAAYPQHHARDSRFYRFIDGLARHAFRDAQPQFEAGRPVPLAELGGIVLPYEKMGAIDSVDLFGLDELLMFAFYHRNRGKYRRGADIGANIGLHSILLSRCGVRMEAFEPDPAHHAKLKRNLGLNGVGDCTAHMAAVSEKKGKMEFVRVLGNTTSSHLAGAKANAYGELERFEVDVHDVREIAARVDFMKIDAEGHEAVILNAVPLEQWRRLDAFVEIGTPQNAEAIFSRFAGTGVNVFSQKAGWSRAESIQQLPASYKEGGAFVSAKAAMPW